MSIFWVFNEGHRILRPLEQKGGWYHSRASTGCMMTVKGMTSSVSKSTRRQLNMLRAAGSYRSVDELLKDLIREHRLARCGW